jgi:hypothetical protein
MCISSITLSIHQSSYSQKVLHAQEVREDDHPVNGTGKRSFPLRQIADAPTAATIPN